MGVYKCIRAFAAWGALNSRRATSHLVRLVEGEERTFLLDDEQVESNDEEYHSKYDSMIPQLKSIQIQKR
ncbi:hypothetical protein TNCV_2101201 [Trichonephila clavipes]|nr:hypothetical protein TNCV_2101201 [Trichonephila clavipes]